MCRAFSSLYSPINNTLLTREAINQRSQLLHVMLPYPTSPERWRRPTMESACAIYLFTLPFQSDWHTSRSSTLNEGYATVMLYLKWSLHVVDPYNKLNLSQTPPSMSTPIKKIEDDDLCDLVLNVILKGFWSLRGKCESLNSYQMRMRAIRCVWRLSTCWWVLMHLRNL